MSTTRSKSSSRLTDEIVAKALSLLVHTTHRRYYTALVLLHEMKTEPFRLTRTFGVGVVGAGLDDMG